MGSLDLESVEWDEFSLEAYAIYKSLTENQKQLRLRGFLDRDIMLLKDTYILDITKMLKTVYSKNLKGFLTNSVGISLSDALNSINSKIFLSKELSRKKDKRRSYSLPEVSYFTYKNGGVKEYLPNQESVIELLDSDDINTINNFVGGVVETGFFTSENKSIWVEKTRLTKVQLVIMNYKPPKNKKATQKEHDRRLYNYLAMILQNAILDYISKTFQTMSREIYEVIDDEVGTNYIDKLTASEDNSQELVQEIELKTDIEKLSNKAFELQEEDIVYNKASIKIVLQLSMYSFQPTEISKILGVRHSVVSEIRELLKEAMFIMASSENLCVVEGLESIDRYTKDMTDNMSEYKGGLKTKSEIENSSMTCLQNQVKELLGRDYYMVQEVREYLDSAI